MTLLQSGAGALRRSRGKGLRVFFSFASMLLLDGCRTWDDGGWHGHRYRHHHQHQRSYHPPPPAAAIVPKFRPPAPPPSLPVQPAYRPPPSGHQWHQRSGEPSRRPGHDHRAGRGGNRHEHKPDGNRGQDHRKRR